MRTYLLIALALSIALTLHCAVNARLLRRSPELPPDQWISERVSVLLPLRDEADRVLPCLRALAVQTGLADAELIVLDDNSSDGTGDLVLRTMPGVRLLVGAPLPEGWTGKAFACQQLADAATGSAFVFLDADVVLAPDGIARTVALLREHHFGFVSPYPRQRTKTFSERLVQPLLQWSWLSTLPLRRAETSMRPSLVAANGQLLAVDAALYRAAGGHQSVRADVLDDVALARALRRAGGTGGFADGTRLATCRMYSSWADLRRGYTKSLWTAFGSPLGGLAVALSLLLIYVLPLAFFPHPLAIAAYASGVVGRWISAARTGGRRIDAVFHPLSVVLFAVLVAMSVIGHRRGALTWRGRTL